MVTACAAYPSMLLSENSYIIIIVILMISLVYSAHLFTLSDITVICLRVKLYELLSLMQVFVSELRGH